MSPSPIVTSAYADRTIIFPQLTHNMVDRSLPYGLVERHPAGATIYERGRRNVDFFVVLSGSVIVLGARNGKADDVITVHQEREFTGELDLFSGRESLVTARAVTDS